MSSLCTVPGAMSELLLNSPQGGAPKIRGALKLASLSQYTDVPQTHPKKEDPIDRHPSMGHGHDCSEGMIRIAGCCRKNMRPPVSSVHQRHDTSLA